MARAIRIAIEHHQAGRLPDAERIYRQVLEAEPENADALHLLGVIALQAGRNETAIELIERALRQRPSNSAFLGNLAGAYAGLADTLSRMGRLAEAESSYRRALELKPRDANTCNSLGTVLANLGRPAEAERSYREGIAVDPRNAMLRYNLGNALRDLARRDEALRCYQEAAALKPDLAEAHYNLANTLKELGRLEEAECAFKRALALKPDYVEALNNRGIVLADLGSFTDAERSYRRALALRPGHARAWNNLGNLLRELGRHEEAEQCYRRAIEHRPDLADVHNHHANALLDLGRHDEAERSYRRALELDPVQPQARSNFLFFLNYVPGRRAAEICGEHREYERLFGRQADSRPHSNAADAERRLRIGYLSGDFRVHSVALFIEPVLAAHDRGACEVFCYYNFPRADAVTERLKRLADHWREVHALEDEALADLIRRDAIDILVDLSGHTAKNRLTVFARKPAPVQVAYLGYPATTGLSAMDYRLTDAIADPVGSSEAYFSEQLVRLPDAMWCYRADDSAIEPAAETYTGRVTNLSGTFAGMTVLADTAGGIIRDGRAPRSRAKSGGGATTFGSFNYFAKLNAEVIALWIRLLQRVPEARLIVTRVPGDETERALRHRFEQSGVARERVELHRILPRSQLLGLFARTDIALDPFPYAGTTTTCDVLWMGIPLVSLAGETTASRSGASLLAAVGLADLVAGTADEYLDIAAALARDPARLAAIRASLRERMRASPLMDQSRFARALESSYRAMWQTWCRRQAA